MSWDIFAQDIPAEATCIADIPNDFRPKPLGFRSDLVSRIKEICPQTDFRDDGWGTISSPGFTIEINIGDDDPVMCIAFHVYGGGMAAGIVADMLDGLGSRAFDTGGVNEFFDRASAQESFRQWRAYRDHVLRQANQ